MIGKVQWGVINLIGFVLNHLVDGVRMACGSSFFGKFGRSLRPLEAFEFVVAFFWRKTSSGYLIVV
jgi:hypothetical protein